MGRSWMSRMVVLVLVLLAGGCQDPGPAEREEEATAPGRLVIIGGALETENSAVYQAILEGRDGDGPLCVFPTASASPDESMQSAVERMDAVGGPGSARGIFLTVDNPADVARSDVLETIRSCSGFYFSGGVQTRIAQVFRPDGVDSPALLAVRDRFRDGAVVSGTSAGAAIMSHPMIGGGSSEGALRGGIRTSESQEEEGVILETGLGFLRDVLVDQHFLARGRWGRLLIAVLGTRDFDLGAGVDENTALVVEGDSAWVAGESGVVLVDAGPSRIRGDFATMTPSETYLEASEVVLYLLGAGDRVNLATRQVRFADDKSPVAEGIGSPNVGSGSANQESESANQRSRTSDLDLEDLFARWALLHFFVESARSGDSVFSYQQHGYGFELRKGRTYRALALPGEGQQGQPEGLSAGPLLLNLAAAQGPGPGDQGPGPGDQGPGPGDQGPGPGQEGP